VRNIIPCHAQVPTLMARKYTYTHTYLGIPEKAS
jgi:hypothetical protein